MLSCASVCLSTMSRAPTHASASPTAAASRCSTFATAATRAGKTTRAAAATRGTGTASERRCRLQPATAHDTRENHGENIAACACALLVHEVDRHARSVDEPDARGARSHQRQASRVTSYRSRGTQAREVKQIGQRSVSQAAHGPAQVEQRRALLIEARCSHHENCELRHHGAT